ncbi:MAG: outer membrane protein assembly factor BamA [Puniceicoccales bacterium]|jgi:outer membrane protein insertion porin family|nr:outer membrane protein assembly factor BamA [Puniceicoccales bacterium]
MYVKKYLALLAMCLIGACASYCELEREQTNAPIISSIKYDYCGGNLSVNQEIIESHVRLREGAEFKQYLADVSIRSLYDTGLFDYIQVRLDQVGNGEYAVTFVLMQKLRVNNINIVGNKKIREKLIRREMSLSRGGTFSDSGLHQDMQKLNKLYQNKGFPYAKINCSVSEADGGMAVDVNVNIEEGPKMHVGRITFDGIGDMKVKVLKDVMQTKSWSLFSIFTGTGIFRRDVLDDDINRLKVEIKNHGYLDVDIGESDVVCTDRRGAVDIHIGVRKGRQYHFGEISIEGNSLYGSDKLLLPLATKSGDIFSPQKVDDACESIRDCYGSVGYLETSVYAERLPNVNAEAIDLVFRVNESERCFLHAVEIKGNAKTKNNVILRELAIDPGDPFDTVQMKNSQLRLLNTRFFQTVDVLPVDTDVKNQKDLRIEVKEANTGKFSVGGGISSSNQVVGVVEFSQSNFDLFGRRNKFQGAGQKFRARFQIGKRNNLFAVNFEEPWLYDRELAFGANLFRSEHVYKKSDYNYGGTSYDETRFGGDVYLRKRLFGLWEGTATYSLASVRISNIGANAPQSFQEERGHRLISRGSFLLELDTRDSFIYPTSGSVLSFCTDVAGGPFFGETKYIKFNATIARFFPTFETFDQNIMLVGRGGTVSAYGGDHVPFFERFFLGGSDYMKGFKTHDVGPRENGTGVGGKSYLYSTVEYTFKIAEPLRFYLFAEAGVVNSSQLNFSVKCYCSDYGFGIKLYIMGAPLRLDFGFPVRGYDNNKHGMRFNYSFGMSF